MIVEVDGSRRRRRSSFAPVMFRYLPGGAVASIGGTFARADASTCATYIDANGVLQTVAANVLRDNHYIGGTRTALLEGSRKNVCLQSEAMNQAVWAKTGSPTMTEGQGPYAGLSFTRYQGTPGTDFIGQTISFTGNATKAGLIFAKQSGAASGTFTVNLRDSTGSADRLVIQLTVAAGGAITGAASVGTLLFTTALASGVYCFGWVSTSVTAADTNIYRLGTAGSCTDILLAGGQCED